METINGYVLLKNMMKKKAAMLDEKIFRAFFSLVEGKTPDSRGEVTLTPVLYHKTDDQGYRNLTVLHKRKSFRVTMSTTRFKSTNEETIRRPARRSIIPNVNHEGVLICDEKSVTDNASGNIDGRYARRRFRSIQGETSADKDSHIRLVANKFAFDIVPDFFMVSTDAKSLF